MNKDTMVKVTNRYNGITGYVIPDLNNLQRTFQPYESKTIAYDELYKLSQIPGGMYIIENNLKIDDAEVAKEIFNAEPEPEFFYDFNDIKNVMVNGSVDAFEDCLNFAPLGVIEIIKELAVSLPLNDMAKRALLFEKTGFNVTNAIENAKEDEEVEAPKAQRKAPVPTKKEEAEPKQNKVVRKVVNS